MFSNSAVSHVSGPTEPPLLELTIGQALEAAVRRWPEHIALISRHQDLRFTWSELAKTSAAFARGLLALGFTKGDRIGIWAPNCAEWAVAQFATAQAGIILVNINPAYRVSELEYTLISAGVSGLICAERFKTSDYVEMIESLGFSADADGSMRCSEAPALRHLIKIGGAPRVGWHDFAEISDLGTRQSGAALTAVASAISPRDPINIQFTSGTTGRPKGATLSHRNVVNNAYFVGLGMGLREGDKLCVPVSLYHCFGMVMSNLASLLHGATIVYPSATFEPLAVLRAVEEERCTALHGVPTMFISELEHEQFGIFDLSSLRTGLMAGSVCPSEVMSKVMTSMHMAEVGVAYGMTETSPVSFQTASSDSAARRVSTIGRIQPHLEAKVVDPVTGDMTSRGVPGELCVRGYSVMLGYWGEPELTKQTIRDGWMRTGDLALIDDEGYGQIVGRAKDMIIRGGENIYPREIEDFLFRHDAVEDVQVVGVPDARLGEAVCACIRRRSGHQVAEDEILSFCRGEIAHHKVPRYAIFLDSFPMTITGKVQKNVLREQATKILGLDR